MMKNKEIDWIDINLPWDGYNEKIEPIDSFSFRKLNKPGTVIETESGSVFLIGHINGMAGICDDCVEFTDNTIIKRYKIVWTKGRDEE